MHGHVESVESAIHSNSMRMFFKCSLNKPQLDTFEFEFEFEFEFDADFCAVNGVDRTIWGRGAVLCLTNAVANCLT